MAAEIKKKMEGAKLIKKNVPNFILLDYFFAAMLKCYSFFIIIIITMLVLFYKNYV